MIQQSSPKNNQPEEQPFLNVGEFPVIVAMQGPLEGKKWDVKAELTIGREQTCDIAIIDRQVSRIHARIADLGNGRIQLEDLASKNGTFHNGKPLDSAVDLEDGDIIQIALVQKLAFYTSDATLPLEDIQTKGRLVSEKIYLDPKSRRVWVNNQELLPPLSAPQFRLLYALSQQSGKVISRNDLIELVWKDEEREGISEQAFDALIRRLRSRLAEIDPETDFLITVRGHGLRLDI